MNIKNKRKISIILLLMMICTLFPLNAYADDTDYAGTTNADRVDSTTVKVAIYKDVVCETTPSDFFVKCLTEKKTIKRGNESAEPDKSECINMIYEAAEKSGLIEYGVLPENATADDLLEYVITNDIFTKTDNYRELKKGDIVFYKNCPGIVIRERTVLFADKNSKLVSIEIKSLDNMDAFTVKYPYFEKLANKYMKEELKYHTAKRCGILANMIAESNINPAAEENTSYRGFGICQWTGDRHESLKKYAEDNGLNIYSLYTQLDFMEKELKEDYAGLNNTLDRYTSPDDDGAYSAAFEFCTRYENPLSADSAVDRGIMAEDELWPSYSK